MEGIHEGHRGSLWVSHTLGGVMAGRSLPNWGEEALVLEAPGKNPADTNKFLWNWVWLRGYTSHTDPSHPTFPRENLGGYTPHIP